MGAVPSEPSMLGSAPIQVLRGNGEPQLSSRKPPECPVGGVRLEGAWVLHLTSLDPCRAGSPPTFAFLASGLPHSLTDAPQPHAHLGAQL